MDSWLPVVLVCIFIGISILIAFLVKGTKNVPATLPPLAFDAVQSGFGKNAAVLTLGPEHVGMSHQIPRILPLKLENIKNTPPKNVHISLPSPTGKITLLQPTSRIDKSALIKLVSKHRFRKDGIIRDHLYMWRVPGEGDVILTPGKTNFGLFGQDVWDCTCSGENLRDDPGWYQDLKNWGKAIGVDN